MDTGKINNYKFFNGYDYGTEVILESDSQNLQVLHIWDGFFWDIFGSPTYAEGWNGFTREFNQFEGAFGDDEEGVITDLQEYAEDLQNYRTKEFKFKETGEVLELLCSWFDEAIKRGCKSITVKIN